MIKRKKALLVIGVVIIIGTISYIGYQIHTEARTTVKIQDYVQNIYKLGDVTRITYQDEVENEVTLEKQGNRWVNNDLVALEYNQEAIAQWIETVQHLTTKERIRNVQDETLYGISETSKMFTLYDAKQQAQTFKIGKVSEAEDNLYIKCDDDNMVYVLAYSEAKALLTPINDFVDCSEVLQIPELNVITIEQKDEKISIVRDDKWYLNDYYTLPSVLEEKAIEEWLALIKEMEIQNYVGTYETLDTFGLTEPRLQLKLNEEVQIAFGKQRGNKVYIKLNEGQDVYTVDQEIYTKLKSFTPFDMLSKQVVHLEIEDIAYIKLVNPQGTYELILDELLYNQETQAEDIKVEETADGQAEDIKTEETDRQDKDIKVVEEAGKAEEMLEIQELEEVPEEFIAVRLNEKELTLEEAKEWFEKIKSSLYIEMPLHNPSLEQKEGRKAEATITYHLKQGEIIQIELIPYDINYYILRYNDVIEFAVSKDKITKMFNELTNFIK